MPSGPDFIALAERVTNIEMRLDDMDAKLDRLVKQNIGRAAADHQNAEEEARRRRKGSRWHQSKAEHERGRDSSSNPVEAFARRPGP